MHLHRFLAAGSLAGASLLAFASNAWAGPETDSAPSTTAQPAGAIERDRDDRYLRTIDDRGGDGKHLQSVTLQMAVRRFERVGAPGPSITMCAAVHVGDKPFYDRLQQLLDNQDVVLYEGVKPPGTGRPEHALKTADDDASRVKSTRMRMRLLAIAARQHERRAGALPESLEALQAGLDGKYRTYFDLMAADAWGTRFVYAAKPASIPKAEPSDAASEPNQASRPAARRWGELEITSLGSDGAVGGEGAAEDILLSAQKPIRPSDLPDADDRGLQHELARALGLVFQLDVMNHDLPNWRNSDLSIDQVQERLSSSGSDPDQIFKMLDGSSFQAGVAKLMLGFMRLMPGMQTIGKLMLLEVLNDADRFLAAAPGMQKTMSVILHDRNEVVLDDLRSVIENEPGVKSVGIIYGGAHMPGLEEGLAALGYREAGVEWLDAIVVNMPGNPAERRQMESMRSSIRQALQRELKRAEKRVPAE